MKSADVILGGRGGELIRCLRPCAENEPMIFYSSFQRLLKFDDVTHDKPRETGGQSDLGHAMGSSKIFLFEENLMPQ